jgi:hypothetical protein
MLNYFVPLIDMDPAEVDSSTGAYQRTVTSSAVAPVQLCADCETRMALIISLPNGMTGSVGMNAAPITSEGITLSTQNPVLSLNFRDHGAAVNKAWFSGVIAGTPTYTVIEIVHAPLYKRAARYARNKPSNSPNYNLRFSTPARQSTQDRIAAITAAIESLYSDDWRSPSGIGSRFQHATRQPGKGLVRYVRLSNQG